MADGNPNSSGGGRIVLGIVLSVLGVMSLMHVYSLRPPEGLGDAFRMLATGSDRYIKEPFYSLFMAASVIATIVGVTNLILGIVRKGRE